MLDVILDQPQGERFVMLALSRTDERVRAGKHIAPGFLFATLLWNEVLTQWNARVAAGEHRLPALDAAIDRVLEAQTVKLAIQRRYSSDMREIWMMQPRFERRNGQAPLRLLEHLRLRAGYDFLLLRCACAEAPAELGQWWTQFMAADEATRVLMTQQRVDTAPGPRKRRRGGRRKAGAGGAETTTAAAGAGDGDSDG
jgi:poly(A) polymerase